MAGDVTLVNTSVKWISNIENVVCLGPRSVNEIHHLEVVMS